jgi:hypothetical protein
MKPLYLIVASAIMAFSLQSFAEDKPGMMKEETAKPGAHMMGKPRAKMKEESGTHMMEMPKEMWTHMQARNAELDKLVETMNSAQGSEKVDAVAAVVNKLVEIHMDMSNRMMQMHKSGKWHGCPMMGGKMMEGEKMGGEMMEKGNDTTRKEEHKHEH